MAARRKWIAGGAIAAGVAVAVLLLALGGGDGAFFAGGGSSSRGGDLDAPILAGGGSPDAGRGGRRAGEGPDGGAAFAAAGEWLPTATVSADPSSPHGSLTGRVVSTGDGAGIEGAELVFEREGTTTSVTSGPGGAFGFSVSVEGRYVLAIATAEGFLPFAPEWGHSPIAFEARAAQRIDGVTVHLVPVVEYRVEVVDASDRPVEGATIRLAGASTGERTMAPVRSTYTTDAEGEARIEGWDWAFIEATHPDHGRGRTSLGRRAQTTRRVRIELAHSEAPAASETIAGVVTDSAGEPVEGALIRAYLMRRGLHPSGQGASGPEGSFELTGLDPGPHMLVATHPGHPRARVRGVETGRDDVRITLEGGRGVRGRVIDEEGRPVPAFTITARRARSALMRRTVATLASYDADGRFLMTGLREGPLELVATSRGYPPSAPVPVTAGSPEPPEVTLTLRRGGRIRGVVRSAADGSPIAGARIALEGSFGRGSSAAPALATSVSAADGSYALDGMASLRSVRVSAQGHHSRILAGLTVAPGAVHRMDIELTPLEEDEEPRTELAGIGVTLFPRGDTLVIRSVVEGGGAEAAGLQRGDAILAVDGTPVTSLGFGGSLDRIRGTEGRPVVLNVRRRGEETASDVTITRRRVRT